MMTHAAILPCSLTLLYPLMLPPAHESTILTLTLMLTLHLVITLQYPLTLLLAYDSMLTFSLVLPAGNDLVIRIGGGPQDSVVFAAGNYSWSSAVNKGGGCNASVFDYRIGDCVVLTPQRLDALLDFCTAVGCKLVYGLSAMYGSCCVRQDDQRFMYGTGHCEGVDLRTCAWNDRSCIAPGEHHCRKWSSSPYSTTPHCRKWSSSPYSTTPIAVALDAITELKNLMLLVTLVPTLLYPPTLPPAHDSLALLLSCIYLLALLLPICLLALLLPICLVRVLQGF